MHPPIASVIEYGLSEDAWREFAPKIQELVFRHGAKTICDIGGGANPVLPLDFVQRNGLDYVIMDISVTELAKAPAGYRTRVQDVTAPLTGDLGKYDLVFSKMLAEHVADGEAFHRNIHHLLRPGGVAFHFFPTLFAPPFIANRLFPERLSQGLLEIFQSGREKSGRNAKFPAHYSWCRGPSRRQLMRFESIGYDVLKYAGYYGHAAYYEKIPVAATLHRKLCHWLTRHPIAFLTSFACVELRKKP